MGGKTVPQRLAVACFGYSGIADGLLDGALDDGLVYVVPPFNPASGVDAAFGCGENELPGPAPVCVRIFPRQRLGQENSPETRLQIPLMHRLDFSKVLLHCRDNNFRKHRDPVLAAFAVANGNLFIGKIYVLDPQAHTLHNPQAAAV